MFHLSIGMLIFLSIMVFLFDPANSDSFGARPSKSVPPPSESPWLQSVSPPPESQWLQGTICVLGMGIIILAWWLVSLAIR